MVHALCSNRSRRPHRLALVVTLAASSALGCTVGRGSSTSPTSTQPAPSIESAEVFHAGSSHQPASAVLRLPGTRSSNLVHYNIVDGLAVMEGDIVLGRADTLLHRFGGWLQDAQVKGAVAVSDRSQLWPNSEIPYVIDASAQAHASRIEWAVNHLNQTSLKLRPRTPADPDYIVFSDEDDGCWSYLGRVGGPQPIQITYGCPQGTIVHEVLHAAGFLHEQSRSDRDDHITIVWDEIIPSARSNFETLPTISYDVGPYDYASILHYGDRAFSRTGRPTIIPKTPGVTIGNREGLSALDRAAIEELYGKPAPSTPQPTIPKIPTSPTTPQTPTPQPTPTQPPTQVSTSGSFAGEYTSAQGNVSCTQNGQTVQCRYPQGTLICLARDAHLDCGWTGSGAGRAAFQRRTDGVVAGTWGDAFSNNSRGAWNWTPVGAGSAPSPTTPAPTTPSQPTPSQPTPATSPTPTPPTSAPASLAGRFNSSRGPMTCTEQNTSWTCDFQDPSGARGQLYCTKDATGLQFSCTWATFLPQPGGGRAVFSRPAVSSRTLTGTWGYLHATTGGGNWEAQGQ